MIRKILNILEIASVILTSCFFIKVILAYKEDDTEKLNENFDNITKSALLSSIISAVKIIISKRKDKC